MTVEDRYVTVAEASAIFGVPRRTLYRWIQGGEHLQASDSEASRGCKGHTMMFLLSEVAHAIARRHADKSAATFQRGTVAQSTKRSHA